MNADGASKSRPVAYVLKLFVCGMTPASEMAVGNICKFFEKSLSAPYELQIVDVLERPDVAELERIVATPTLVKERPEPRELLIGDLSNESALRVLFGMPADRAD